ncbi:long-chain fatty acid--CoA ligase [Saccharomonospora sp.]|uniref:acyl-CoA synthetase n=1 Tax=Saccharomonospora sp. TaxID=33913 RepID=UPI00260EF03D|nr:long-chain fatty acid--CoA ligase [Saccharomonospora sp.]
MLNHGLGSWPTRRARMTPNKTAVRFRGGSLDYAELDERATRVAHGLHRLGVRFGDRVAYLGPNRPAYLECLFASGMLGAVFVPVNVRLTAAEVDHVLADSGASVLVYTGEHEDTFTRTTTARHLRTVAVDGGGGADHEYEELFEATPTDFVCEPVGLDDPCLIMYTSGSTGRPKGAVLTHGNLTWNCVNVLVESELANDEVTLVVAPLFHAAALGMSCLPTLLKGGTVVLQDTFDPEAVLESIERHRVTWMFGVPTMFNALAAHPRWLSADLSSVRTLSCGGAPVPTETIRRYLDRGLSFVQGYGMTEAAPGVTILDREHAKTKIGSAGVPSFFTDVRVVDGSGEDVGPGQRGEVVVSGPNVMRGYWGRPEETSRVLRDGWFRSGDVATVDDDGYLYLVDRIKDVIISGGENVYPAEVENELYGYGGIDVCAVIGVPDEKWGEVGKAVIVPAEGVELVVDELVAYLRERLAAYKVPRRFQFVDSLPTTGSGKLLKGRIRELYG